MNSREQFEKRFPVPATCEGFNGGFYFMTNARSGKEERHPHHAKWVAWEASREAIEVELPQRWSVDGFESGWVADPEGANLDYAETVKAIEAAGLKVKPC